MMSALRLKSIDKSFTQGDRQIEVLRGISLAIEPGEVVALTGSSGAGKSTLLQIAGLLDRPSAGDVVLEGITARATEDERTMLRQQKLGFVYQFHHLMPDFTALENIAIAARIAGLSARRASELAADSLDAMGLTDRAGHVPAQLSGGEQQRVAIARALVHGPAVLLADEPTGNLDDATSGRVFDLLLSLARERNIAALIATHDQSLAAKMDRQLTIRGGYVAAL